MHLSNISCLTGEHNILPSILNYELCDLNGVSTLLVQADICDHT